MIRPQRLGHVVLRVRDLDRSLAFYTRVTGLKIAAHKRETGQSFLSYGDDHHALALFEAGRDDAGPVDRRLTGMSHTGWELEDPRALDAAREALESDGMEVEQRTGGAGRRSILFPDPDGNRVELYCDADTGGRVRRDGS